MSKNLDIDIQTSKLNLLNQFASSPDLVFFRAWGNIGDELIYAGTRQLLSGLTYREVSIQNAQNVSGHTALISGSGGWCKPFHAMPEFLKVIEDNFQKVVIMPSSFDITEETVRNALVTTDAIVFARERVSYEQIQPLCKANLAYDCAFYFDFEKYVQPGQGVLNAFRTDAEASNKDQTLPEGNIDVSVVCSSLDEWLWLLSSYDLVRTDRAHVMIAAAMLGKRVEYYSSAYHKVPAIAEYSLKRYPVTRIPEVPQEGLSNSIDQGSISSSATGSEGVSTKLVNGGTKEFVDFLAARSGCSRVCLLDDLRSDDIMVEYPRDTIFLIPDAISSIIHSPHLIERIKELAQGAQKVILTDDIHSVTTSVAELEKHLKRHSLPVEFVGYTNETNRKAEIIVILDSKYFSPTRHAPDDFQVVAVISSYNEEDIIIPVIEQLNRDGIGVYLIDNWSTDETFQRAKSLLGKGLIGIEKYPAEGPSSTYDWMELLKRKEEIGQELEADWFIHHDVDEFRESPWQGMTLRDAIYRVDQEGYNAVDFTVLNYYPIDNNYPSGTALQNYFKHFEFGTHPAYFTQIQAWKKSCDRVDLHSTGGHSVGFSGRKIYPYKFLLHHFPIRSQAHGEKKILQERKPRYSPQERKIGMHNHYDHYSSGSCFLKNPEGLIKITPGFYQSYLIERLSGIGIIPQETVIITKLEKQVREREQAIQAQKAQVNELEQTIQSLTNFRVEREQESRALIFRMEEYEQERQVLRGSVEELEQELVRIKNSKELNIGLKIHQIYSKAAPPNSLRARAFHQLRRLLRSFSQRINRYRNLRKYPALIRSSHLFDEVWYLANNPDISQAKMDPLRHYLIFGGFEGRDPGPNFSTSDYLAMNEDVRIAEINPLVHYLLFGREEGRTILPSRVQSPLLDQ